MKSREIRSREAVDAVLIATSAVLALGGLILIIVAEPDWAFASIAGAIYMVVLATWFDGYWDR